MRLTCHNCQLDIVDVVIACTSVLEHVSDLDKHACWLISDCESWFPSPGAERAGTSPMDQLDSLLHTRGQRIVYGGYKFLVRGRAAGSALRISRTRMLACVCRGCRPSRSSISWPAIELSMPYVRASKLIAVQNGDKHVARPRLVSAARPFRAHCLGGRLVDTTPQDSSLTSTDALQRNAAWLPGIACSLVDSALKRRAPKGLLERQGLYSSQRPLANPLIWFHAHTAGVCSKALVVVLNLAAVQSDQFTAPRTLHPRTASPYLSTSTYSAHTRNPCSSLSKLSRQHARLRASRNNFLLAACGIANLRNPREFTMQVSAFSAYRSFTAWWSSTTRKCSSSSAFAPRTRSHSCAARCPSA